MPSSGRKKSFPAKIFSLYYDGFRSMTWGRNLWIIIIIKLFIMFAILRIFFFQDFLNSRFSDNKAKSDYVINELTNRSEND